MIEVGAINVMNDNLRHPSLSHGGINGKQICFYDPFNDLTEHVKGLGFSSEKKGELFW